MTFLEIQNAAMNDRFNESQRADVKNWINFRYGRIWAQDAWNFKLITVTTTLPLSSNIVSLSALGIQRVVAVWDGSFGSYQVPITSARPEDFFNFTSTSAGYPVDFTVVGTNIVFNRPASGARNLTILGEAIWAPLSADGDVPLLPSEFHFVLVQGASAEGLRLQNDPTWRDFEADSDKTIAEMRIGYLTAVKTYQDAYPAWVY